VEDLQLKEIVSFFGYRFDYLQWIESMDLLVVPSTFAEDFPLASLEAMALGKPLVASALAGLNEQVVPGETGYLVPPGNITMLAAALERLVDSPAERAQMGARAHERYLKEYVPSIFLERYLALYSELLNPGFRSSWPRG
jgi:glycosyltransferase involved in cell wall biosynthesis